MLHYLLNKSYETRPVRGAKTFPALWLFAEGLFFSNILQILFLKYCSNIEELTDLI